MRLNIALNDDINQINTKIRLLETYSFNKFVVVIIINTYYNLSPQNKMKEEKMANAVNWFEIPVTDMDRAKRFYESVFDIEMNLTEMGPMLMAWFPMEEGAEGAAGTLIKSEGYTPSYEGSMVYFSVNDIKHTLSKIEKNGGKVVNPKTDIGKYGFVAHFEDCEGNRVALHSNQ